MKGAMYFDNSATICLIAVKFPPIFLCLQAICIWCNYAIMEKIELSQYRKLSNVILNN